MYYAGVKSPLTGGYDDQGNKVDGVQVVGVLYPNKVFLPPALDDEGNPQRNDEGRIINRNGDPVALRPNGEPFPAGAFIDFQINNLEGANPGLPTQADTHLYKNVKANGQYNGYDNFYYGDPGDPNSQLGKILNAGSISNYKGDGSYLVSVKASKLMASDIPYQKDKSGQPIRNAQGYKVPKSQSDMTKAEKARKGNLIINTNEPMTKGMDMTDDLFEQHKNIAKAEYQRIQQARSVQKQQTAPQQSMGNPYARPMTESQVQPQAQQQVQAQPQAYVQSQPQAESVAAASVETRNQADADVQRFYAQGQQNQQQQVESSVAYEPMDATTWSSDTAYDNAVDYGYDSFDNGYEPDF